MYVQGDGLRAVAAVMCTLGNRKYAVADTFSKSESVRNVLRQSGLLLKSAPSKNTFTVFIGGEEAAENAVKCATKLGMAPIPAILVKQPSGGDTDFATFIVLKALQGESSGQMLRRLSDRRAEFEEDNYVFGSL